MVPQGRHYKVNSASSPDASTKERDGWYFERKVWPPRAHKMKQSFFSVNFISAVRTVYFITVRTSTYRYVSNKQEIFTFLRFCFERCDC